LTNNAKPDVWSKYNELIIVPDGVLWYLPFEALPVVEGESSTPLITKLRVRYVPTLSLIPPDPRGLGRLAETAVVAGRLFPRDDTIGTEALEKLRGVSDRVVDLRGPLSVSSCILAARCNRLVVLADLDENVRGPYDWSPMQLDRGKVGASLGAWMTLPWDGPQQIILPGFHTAAENGLKRGGNGDELFLATCGLMASGARTILLSRWRTGGQTSYDLVHEFVQELPYAPASDAWQRSVQLLMDDKVVLEREPRVKAADLDVDLRADHPFFWAGYLLVDTGSQPKTDALPGEPPAAEPGKPAEKPAEKPPEKPAAESPPKPAVEPDAAAPSKPAAT
jgi:hypothetical protein